MRPNDSRARNEKLGLGARAKVPPFLRSRWGRRRAMTSAERGRLIEFADQVRHLSAEEIEQQYPPEHVDWLLRVAGRVKPVLPMEEP